MTIQTKTLGTPARATLHLGESIDVLATLADNSIDAIVCDPPYGLSSEPDPQEVLRHWLAGDDYAHRGGGFMGKSWDSFVPGPATWAQAYRVLRPGGHLLAFAGSRTQDLMGLAIRLAGFEMRDTLQWLYGSGFPKSLDVSKAIDKMGGDPSILNEMAAAMLKAREDRQMSAREAATHFGFSPDAWAWWDGTRKGQTAAIYPPDEERAVRIASEWTEVAPIFARLRQRGMLKGTKVHGRSGGEDFGKVVGSEATSREVEEFDHATPEAAQWEGWGTALKPAYEPIIMARKPLRVDGRKATVAKNVLAHGTGALNIDATRISTNGEVLGTPQSDPTKRSGVVGTDLGITGSTVDAFQAAQAASIERTNTLGRWPANVLLPHHEDCVEVGTRHHTERIGGGASASKTDTTTVDFVEGYERGDGWVGQEVSAEVPVFDCHDDCPVRLLDEQTGIIKGKVGMTQHASNDGSGAVFGGFNPDDESKRQDGVVDSGGASRFFYSSKTSKRERNAGMPEGVKNTHPTVKPVEVMRWLVKMVTPPGGIVLDPFMGSGTTGIAAVSEGFEFIGIDNDRDSARIAWHRIRHVLPTTKETT